MPDVTAGYERLSDYTEFLGLFKYNCRAHQTFTGCKVWLIN